MEATEKSAICALSLPKSLCICPLCDFDYKIKKHQRCQGGMAKKAGRNMLITKADDYCHVLEGCFSKQTHTILAVYIISIETHYYI